MAITASSGVQIGGRPNALDRYFPREATDRAQRCQRARFGQG
jgi:hypothetical protein